MSNEMEETMWYLITCEKDDSIAIVDSSAVLNADRVRVNDTVTFFYHKKAHIGKIGMISADRDLIDGEVKNMGKKPKHNQRKAKATVKPKRQSSRPNRFTPAVSSSPLKRKPTSSQAQMKKLKVAAEQAINKEVLKEGGSAMKGKNDLIKISDDETSDDELLSMLKEKEVKKAGRNALMEKIRNQTISPPLKDVSDTPSTSKNLVSSSPTKEQLQKMLLDAQFKLSIFEDNHKNEDDNEKKKIKHGDSIKNSSVLDECEDTPDVPHASPPLIHDYEFHDSSSWGKDEKDNCTKHSDKTTSRNENESSESETEPSTDIVSEQLLGKDHTEPMMLLCDGIYCTQSAMDSAVRQSSKGTHMVRRLLTGVFKHEAIVTCTLTGQKPRAAGKDNYGANAPMVGLNATAINAIFTFTKKFGKAKNWERPDMKQWRQTLTQKIGEVTREYKNKKTP